ncbi:helix-turn-helix domain-containing protein [Consotaella aegiceratis]|uniref:helix-turn-helix domain-containing protein n=1 Tax=Consotaella aegiceratis TaxID=3097961 RepID=UPI002F41B201
MGFHHSMISHTEGIRPVAPAKWRSLNGIMSVFWDAEGQRGAKGHYLSPDPRIMIFFNDVSSHIRMSNRMGGLEPHYRPMTRAMYVPAGLPLQTSFVSMHRFAHLDLHVHKDRLLRFLSPSVGGSAAQAALRRPTEIQNAGAIETLARLLVGELSSPSKHPVHSESLVGSIATALLDIPEPDGERPNGRLTQAQMNKLTSRINSRSDRRLAVAEMAATVGLSESWFACVFKQTTGQTPLQWQLANRIELAKRLLADSDHTLAAVAVQLGFADQAHLTKAFRRIVGETPAAWRRKHRPA